MPVAPGLEADEAHPGSSMKRWKMPIALEPPPTQAITASGRRPVVASTCSRASTPMIRWNSRTISGNGCGPVTVPRQVVGGLDGGDPVAHGLVDRVLEGAAAVLDGDDLGAQQLHAGHVERLPLGVDLAHVDLALQAEQRRRGRGGDAVLARRRSRR
jgi:hypothetical protein